jgi:hypothetical protein
MKNRLLSICALVLFCLTANAAGPGGFVDFNGSVTNTAVLMHAGQFLFTGYNISNPNSSTCYLQVYDAASTAGITVGTTAPKFAIAVPSTGVTDGLQVPGAGFANGLVVAWTTTPTGGSAPASNASVTIFKN